MDGQAVEVAEQAVEPDAGQDAPGEAAAPHTSSAPPSLCQVPGCGVDLVGLAQFYRRVRICEEHGKAHSITDAQGRVMRFCQQCSKLQPLELFMGDRRSCAASLDKRRARRKGAAASVRASGEASPGHGDGEWQAVHRKSHIKRRSSASQGSPEAEETPGQLGASKRHSLLRDSGSLGWSTDSLAGELPLAQPQLAASSRGGSSLGSPGLSLQGWPVSSGASEGAANGAGLTAAAPAAEAWQLSAGSSPMPSIVLSGNAGSFAAASSMQLPLLSAVLLPQSGAPSAGPAHAHLQRPAATSLRLVPPQRAMSVRAASSSAPSSLLPLATAASRPVPGEQLWPLPPVLPPVPAPQQYVPDQPVAAHAAQQLAQQPSDSNDPLSLGNFEGLVLDDELLAALDVADASDLMHAFSAVSELDRQQPANPASLGLSLHMSAAQLEADAAAAAVCLDRHLIGSQLADLAALGLSYPGLLPGSPAATAGGSSAAGLAAAGGSATASPATHQHSLPQDEPGNAAHVQQMEQWQHAQLHDLQHQVRQLHHPVGQPAAPTAPLRNAVSLPLPAATAPDSSPAAASPQIWDMPQLCSDRLASSGNLHVVVENVDRHHI